jgi:hypothetical protein
MIALGPRSLVRHRTPLLGTTYLKIPLFIYVFWVRFEKFRTKLAQNFVPNW